MKAVLMVWMVQLETEDYKEHLVRLVCQVYREN